jgi:hypothetical protein
MTNLEHKNGVNDAKEKGRRKANALFYRNLTVLQTDRTRRLAERVNFSNCGRSTGNNKKATGENETKN